MEVHSHGVETLGASKEADKVYNPELKDIAPPLSSQIPTGENFTVPSTTDTASVHVNDEPLKNDGVESNATPAFSFPQATSDLNTSPDIAFQHFDSVQTEQGSQHECNQVAEQDEAFDDMVILENDVVTSATAAGGADETLDGFQVENIQIEGFHEPPASDIYNDSAVAPDAAVAEQNVDGIIPETLNPISAEETVTLTTDVTIVTTVIKEVTVVELMDSTTVELATDLATPAENELPSAPVTEVGEAKISDAAEDSVMANITADSDTAQKSEPTIGSHQVISDEEIRSIKGQKVVKKFGRKNFFGEVVDFDPDTKWFKVVYNDGDNEDLELSEVKEILSSTNKKRPRVDGDPDDESSGKTGKKPRKIIDSASTAKKSRSGSESAVKSPRTPKSKAKGSNSSKKSSSSKKVKSPGKLIKKALNSSAFKTPVNSEVKGEKGKGSASMVTPKGTKRDSSKKRNVRASRNLKLQSPESKRKGKVKASAESSGSKRAKSASSKRKAIREETNSEKSKRSRKAASGIGADTDLVGKRVRKNFDGSMYDGVVLRFDKKTQFYKVKYSDGDQEDLELHELEPILILDLSNADEKDDKPAKISSLSSLMSADKASGTEKRK